MSQASLRIKENEMTSNVCAVTLVKKAVQETEAPEGEAEIGWLLVATTHGRRWTEKENIGLTGTQQTNEKKHFLPVVVYTSRVCGLEKP